MSEVVIDTKYRPRNQQAYIHSHFKRYNVLVCHRGMGKSWLVINEMIHSALTNLQKDVNGIYEYAYIAPTYGQAKRIAWDKFKMFCSGIPWAKTNEQDLRIDIKLPNATGYAKIMLLGAENPNSIRGLHLCGAALDEYAEMDPSVWTQVVRPTLSQNKGWVIFIGTPKGQNHFYDIYKLAKERPAYWFSAIYKASDTGLVDPDDLEEARATMGDEEFLQEYECSFNSPQSGAYYAKQMEAIEGKGRITKVLHDPALSVDTFWDLGIGDATAVWFVQQLGTEYRLIDYYVDSGQPLSYYAKMLSQDHRKEYNYIDHVMPHDAAARELQTGKSRQEMFRSLTGKNPIILPRHAVDDGINSVRTILPRCWFDAEKLSEKMGRQKQDFLYKAFS